MRIDFIDFKSSFLVKVFTCVSMICLSHFALAGTASGGGGNLCYIDGQPVLLELANYRPILREEGLKFEATNMTKLYGFSALTKLNTGKIKERVDAILNANIKNSPIMISWLRKITSLLSFSLTSASINTAVKADTSQFPDCDQANTKASILYFPPLMGLVDLEQFNSLDLDSQAGLILHESGRFFQLMLKTNPNSVGAQASDIFTDARLQKMVLTLFEVYWGKSDATIDQEDLFSALEETLFIDIFGTDLCLENFAFKEAKIIVYQKNGISNSKLQSVKDGNIQFFHEIRYKQDEMIRQAPEAFGIACRLQSEYKPWYEQKKKILSLKEKLKDTPLKGFYARAKKELDNRLTKILQKPLEEKNHFRNSLLKGIPNLLDKVLLINATLNLQLFWISVSADSYYKIRDDFFLSTEKKHAIKEIEQQSCNSRENLKEWFHHGAPDASEGKSISALEQILEISNPKCQ